MWVVAASCKDQQFYFLASRIEINFLIGLWQCSLFTVGLIDGYQLHASVKLHAIVRGHGKYSIVIFHLTGKMSTDTESYLTCEINLLAVLKSLNLLKTFHFVRFLQCMHVVCGWWRIKLHIVHWRLSRTHHSSFLCHGNRTHQTRIGL